MVRVRWWVCCVGDAEGPRLRFGLVLPPPVLVEAGVGEGGAGFFFEALDLVVEQVELPLELGAAGTTQTEVDDLRLASSRREFVKPF